MLHNGKWYNRYLEIALGYLPDEIYEKYENKIEFFTTAECDACRIARVLCEEKEIILLSERILPNTIDVEDNNNGRYFLSYMRLFMPLKNIDPLKILLQKRIKIKKRKQII